MQTGKTKLLRTTAGRFMLSALLASLFIVLFPLRANAGGKLAPELKGRKSTDQVDVVVQFTTAPTDRHYKKLTGRGAALKSKLDVIKGGAFQHLPASALAELAADPDVAYITPDRPVHLSATDYAEATVNANLAWNLGFDGSGVGVAVLDSGIVRVADLNNASQSASRVVYRQNFVPDWLPAGSDIAGHGTHVAGIIGGNGYASSTPDATYTVRGVAPNVNLISLRVLDANGNGTDSSVIWAIQTAIWLKNTYNIRVMNLSLGRPVFESYTQDPLCQAVEAAWKAGIVVVVAAGNQGRNNSAGTNGYGTIAAPGNDPYVITVGAMRTMDTASRADDLIATYSSKGPTAFDHVVKPDVVAPGNRIVSLLSPLSSLTLLYPLNDVFVNEYRNTLDTSVSSSYFRLSGTSMAAPVVSGAAALMIQADPTLTPDTVKARLMKSAAKTFPQYSSWTDPATGVTYTSQYDAFTVGAGYVDVAAALAATDVVPAGMNAKSPSVTYDPNTGNTYLVTGSSVIWGSSVVWGSSVIWGSSVNTDALSGQSIVWGSSVVWGSSTSDAFSVIWGSSVLWGASNDAAQTADVVAGDN